MKISVITAVFNREALPYLIKQHDIDRIVITAELPEAVRRELRGIAAGAGIRLTEWQYWEVVLEAPRGEAADAGRGEPAVAGGW